MIKEFNIYKGLKDIYCQSSDKFTTGMGLSQSDLAFGLLLPNRDNELMKIMPNIRSFLRVQRVELVKVFIDELLERCKYVMIAKQTADTNLNTLIGDYVLYKKELKGIFEDMHFEKGLDDTILLFYAPDSIEYKKYKETEMLVKE